jgi:hypothetical protein
LQLAPAIAEAQKEELATERRNPKAPARTCDSRLLATPSPAVGLNIPFPITYLQVMNLDLTDEETAALTRLLSQTIDANRYPLSPRIQTLKAILAKIRPEPKRDPLPPLKHYEPPRATAARRRR